MINPTVGIPPLPSAERDAIHVAIVPVRAGDRMHPGAHARVVKRGNEYIAYEVDEYTGGDKAIGIVDPFLTETVGFNERCWLLLYPNTVTSLRHEWTHPAFANPTQEAPLSPSVRWITEYADECGMTYRAMMAAAEAYVKDGSYHRIGFDTPQIVYSRRGEFWKHYEIITGQEVEDHDGSFISCSC